MFKHITAGACGTAGSLGTVLPTAAVAAPPPIPHSTSAVPSYALSGGASPLAASPSPPVPTCTASDGAQWSIAPSVGVDGQRLHRWGHSAEAVHVDVDGAARCVIVVYGGFEGYQCHSRTSDVLVLDGGVWCDAAPAGGAALPDARVLQAMWPPLRRRVGVGSNGSEW